MEVSVITKQFRGIIFVLRQDEYQNLIKRLREGVSSLEELLSGNMELEPDRRRDSQGRLYRLLGDISASIYEALRSAVTCACPGLHDVGLQLMSQPAVITPHDDDDNIIKSQKFHLILSSASTALASGGNLGSTNKLWKMLSLSVCTSNHGDTLTATTAITSTSSRGVRFSSPTREKSDISQARDSPSNTSGLGVAVTSTLNERKFHNIDNLCQALRRSRKQGIGECCGQICDGSSPHRNRVYQVYPLGSPSDNGNWSLVSLRSVFAGEADAALMYGDRLRLAWVVASSVLQLQGTPWLSRALSHDGIFLTQQDGDFRDVFVMKHFPEPLYPACNRVSAAAHRTKSANLKALGILLIELIFGQTMDRLRSTLSGSVSSVFAHRAPGPLSDYETAMGLMDQINTRVGSNYCSAVKRCINYDYYQGSAGFGAGLRKDVLVDVLTLLEQDLERVMS